MIKFYKLVQAEGRDIAEGEPFVSVATDKSAETNMAEMSASAFNNRNFALQEMGGRVTVFNLPKLLNP